MTACFRCGRDFYRNKPTTDICWGCWYEGEMEEATNAFTPLSTWLERLLEVRTTVDQTGGMVMCLRVPIGREDERGRTPKYAYFSEYPFDACGVGLFHDLDGEWDSEGEFVEFPDADRYMCHAGSCGWYHHPDLAEALARWAAPIIVEFATKEETP